MWVVNFKYFDCVDCCNDYFYMKFYCFLGFDLGLLLCCCDRDGRRRAMFRRVVVSRRVCVSFYEWL